MNTPICPTCQAGLDGRGAEARCDQCETDYRIRALCPTCRQELERLKACGAVDYFCNHCNSLISKRAVRFEVTSLTAQ